jgi:Domain of unknown function (DUF4124)
VPALLVILLSLYAPISVAQMYRWVDSNGKVHYGDVVPDPYKASARLVDGGSEPTPEQAREAAARAERDRLEAAERERARRATSKPPAPRQPVQAATSAQPSCEAEWKKFAEVGECYAPFLFQGGIRPGAFEKCGPAATQPTCGPQPAQPTPERTYIGL